MYLIKEKMKRNKLKRTNRSNLFKIKLSSSKEEEDNSLKLGNKLINKLIEFKTY